MQPSKGAIWVTMPVEGDRIRDWEYRQKGGNGKFNVNMFSRVETNVKCHNSCQHKAEYGMRLSKLPKIIRENCECECEYRQYGGDE